MTQKLRLMGLGTPSFLADRMAAGTVSNTLTATGSSSLANSYGVTDDVSIFTTAAGNSGARLPANSTPGDVFYLFNYDANTMLIYPPTSATKLNNGTAGASLSLATLKGALCISIDGNNYGVIVGA